MNLYVHTKIVEQHLIGPLIEGTEKIASDCTDPPRHICLVHPVAFANWLEHCTTGFFESHTHSTIMKTLSKASYGAIAFTMAQVSASI